MLTDDEIDGMRVDLEDGMPAECEITRPTTAGVFDPETGLYSEPATETVYEGPCRVRTLYSQGLTRPVGDLAEEIGRYQVAISHDSAGVEVNDYLTVTDGTDPVLIGRSLRIADVRWSEWHLSRHLTVEDMQARGPVE